MSVGYRRPDDCDEVTSPADRHGTSPYRLAVGIMASQSTYGKRKKKKKKKKEEEKSRYVAPFTADNSVYFKGQITLFTLKGGDARFRSLWGTVNAKIKVGSADNP